MVNNIYDVITSCVSVIELACGEYGEEKVDTMVEGTDNGRSDTWFQLPEGIKDSRTTGTNTQPPSMCGEIHIICNNIFILIQW
jgi:hypothetical protein